jgi:hypothetical protein
MSAPGPDEYQEVESACCECGEKLDEIELMCIESKMLSDNCPFHLCCPKAYCEECWPE